MILTDRYHASNGNYDANDPQNQIGGIIPVYPLSGWLRHGMEKVVQQHGHTACHPGESTANFMKADVYDRDFEAGYHEKGVCVDDPKADDGCVIFDLFGGFEGIPGKLIRRPIKFSPVRASIGYTCGQAEGHYRRLNRNVVSRNPEDNREALRNTEIDAVANLDGCWHLSFRQTKPEFLGLLAKGIEYLDAHIFSDLYLVVCPADERVSYRTVYVGESFGLRIDANYGDRPALASAHGHGDRGRRSGPG